MARIDGRWFALPLLMAPMTAHAQAVPTAPADVEQREGAKRQLQELVRSRQELQQTQQTMQQQIDAFDARIAALEAELGVAPSKQEIVRLAPIPRAEEDSGPAAADEKDGPFKPGVGLVLAQGKNAGLALGVNGYVRYLNQGGLKSSYTDSFGRTFQVDKRQDVQLNRLQLQFRGWMFDERFRWTFYAWTQNVSQGDPAQVVVGGNINYTFSENLRVFAGIFSVPSTRRRRSPSPTG